MNIVYDSADEIRGALDSGVKVYWGSEYYPVIKDSMGQYLITCTQTAYCVGLTWQDGKTLNGDSTAFYTPA